MIPKNFRGVEILSEMDCSCTEDQQTGKDPSLCITCRASSALNRLGREKRDIVVEIFGRNERI